MSYFHPKRVVKARYDNSIDPFIPEIWANEGLRILEENMVMTHIVHRGFSPQFARFGDIVHTRRPAELVGLRKTISDDITLQDVTATDVAVPLNQYFHASFIIRDGEQSYAFQDLIQAYLRPAMRGIAVAVDRLLLGQHFRFWANYGGGLGLMTDQTSKNYILDVREKMNVNKADPEGRNFILTPSAETTLLKLELFTAADKVGDDGSALRNASLGRKLGFDFFMCQNACNVQVPSAGTVVSAVNNSAGYPIGTTALTVDGGTTQVAGGWIKIAGDDTPQQIVSLTGGGGATTAIVITPGLRRAVLNDAVITGYYGAGLVNQGVSVTGYAAGYQKSIAYDGATAGATLQVGQTLSFGSATDLYTVINKTALTATTGTIWLDRPLDAAIANDAVIQQCPPGTYNLAIQKDALAFVNRPLEPPRQGVGARSGVASLNDLSMRVVITYDGMKQGHIVTFDMLAGIALLDVNQGAVLFG